MASGDTFGPRGGVGLHTEHTQSNELWHRTEGETYGRR